MDRFRRLGLQKRIMLYVTVGLALLFGVVAFVGLGAIDQATQLVFGERLTTAHTTAGILERDLARVATDVGEAELQLGPAAGAGASETAQRLLDHFTRTDPYPFFQVSGIWLLDASPGARYMVLRALAPVACAFAFADVAVRTSDPSGAGPGVVVHTVSINSTSSYVPASHGRIGPGAATGASAGASEEYHLEVVDPDGIAVLGIGQDERPGQPSNHFPAIRRLVADRSAAALLHEPGQADRFEPHVMAVVPLENIPSTSCSSSRSTWRSPCRSSSAIVSSSSPRSASLPRSRSPGSPPATSSSRPSS